VTELLSAPALAGPAPGATAPTEAVVARLGDGRFAVDLAHVAEVGRVPDVTRVPGVPTWLAGVANWRGRVLPVLDIRTLVGAPAAPLTSRARLVVLAVAEVSVGLLVDAVEGTTEVGADAAPFPVAVAGLDRGLLAAQLPRDDGPIAVLDAVAVLRLREELPRGRRTA
jgi:purine-binding chemotaxis protein CheW